MEWNKEDFQVGCPAIDESIKAFSFFFLSLK